MSSVQKSSKKATKKQILHIQKQHWQPLQIVKCVYNAIIATVFVSPSQMLAIVSGQGETAQQSPRDR